MDIYRMILEIDAPDQKYATGATYPGCERVTNPTPCDPQGFMELSEAIGYAHEHGEIPIRVTSVAQVDDIIAGHIPITPDMVLTGASTGIGDIFANIPTPVLLGGAIVLLMILSKRKKQ